MVGARQRYGATVREIKVTATDREEVFRTTSYARHWSDAFGAAVGDVVTGTLIGEWHRQPEVRKMFGPEDDAPPFSDEPQPLPR